MSKEDRRHSDRRAGALRVVHVIDTMGVGGTELTALRLAGALDRARFSLSTVCLTGPGPLTDKYTELGIRLQYLHIKSLYGIGTLASVGALATRLHRTGVDLVHAHDMYSNVLITLAGRLAGVPVITSQRWAWGYPAARYRVLNRWAHRHSNVVLANSEAAVREVRDATGLPSTRVVMLPNFVTDDLLAGDAGQRRLDARSLMRIPPDAVVVGCVGRLHPIKDHGTLLRAMKVVVERVPAARLVIVGDGPSEPMLRELITNLSLDSNVVMLGHREDAAALAAAFDVVALSSRSESFPNALMEAMAQCVPVVATRVGGVPELVRAGQDGLLVPAGDPAQLGQALAVLLTNDEGRLSMGRSARERIEELHSSRVVMRRLETLYETLSGGGAVR